MHDEGDLDVVVERQGAVTNDVDIGLDELTEAPLLRTLAAPDLLDLVALEREGKQPGVVNDVTGEGNSEVEVEAQLLTGVRLGVGLGGVRLQTVEEIDLLRGLALPRQLAQRLDGAGLDAAEAMELEVRRRMSTKCCSTMRPPGATRESRTVRRALVGTCVMVGIVS